MADWLKSARRGPSRLAIATSLLLGLALVAATLAPAGTPPSASAAPVIPNAVPVCPGPASPGSTHCHAWVRTDVGGGGRITPNAATPSGYVPADLQAAYALASAAANNGSGATVAIVDAYDDPNAESDLAVYRSQFGLPACTTANGCFKKVNQTGGTSYPNANGGWAQEISLDLDMVSAICPNCHILLVEATSNSMANLGAAVNYAAGQPGVVAISNSYGGGEYGGETADETSYFEHPGIAVTVSSGDNGYGVEFPAASQYVTAVGGTHLTTAATARGWTETVWSGAGSGCSAYISKPSWQTDSGCSKRTVADVSAVADPNTGVAVYDSYAYQGRSGWLVFGGTSVASPIIASVYALGGHTSSLNYGSYPYSHTGSLNDVTSGSNGSCGGGYLCTGVAGYDGPTGNGSPNGTSAFGGVSGGGTPTSTPTATSTSTASPTATSTATRTSTPTPTSTPAPTSTATATSTPTSTNTSAPTSTPTSTNTSAPTSTATSTPTNTPLPPTATSTGTATLTPLPSNTPTQTPLPATSTPTFTSTPLASTSTPTNTPLPPTSTPTVTNTPTATIAPTPTATLVPGSAGHLWDFLSGTDGWTASAGSQSVLSYDSVDTSPSGGATGSLQASIGGRNKNNTNVWYFQGTWEQLGVTPGNSVTQAQLTSISKNVSQWTSVQGVTWDVELQDSTGVTQATLLPSKTETGADTSWPTDLSGLPVPVPSALQASNSTVRIAIVANMDLANSPSAVATLLWDHVSLSLTTLGAPNPTPSPTAIPTATGTPTDTPTATPTVVAASTSTPTVAPTATSTTAPTPTNTAVPSATPTSTPAPLPTSTPTNTPLPSTSTPSQTPVPATSTPPPTSTATPTQTLVPATSTATSTSTPLPTGTPTSTPPPATSTPTNTPVPPTSTATATATNTPLAPTSTPTATATNTPLAPTSTPTNTPLPPTNTPLPTATSTATPLPTATPTQTPLPTATATSTAAPTATATSTPGSGGTTLVQDTFTRVVSSGWGAADTGGAWALGYTTGGDASSTGSVDGQRGNLTITTGSSPLIVSSYVGPAGYGDYDVLATVRAGQSASSRLYVLGRVGGQGTFYALQLDIGANQVTLRKASNGAFTTLATAATPSPALAAGVDYRVRLRLLGTTLSARWWVAGTSEPTTWAITASDATFSSGQVGVGAALGTSRTTGAFSFDDVSASSLP